MELLILAEVPAFSTKGSTWPDNWLRQTAAEVEML